MVILKGLDRSEFVLGEAWIFIVLLLCMALLAYVHNMYPARFTKLFKSTFNERMTRQVMREEMVFSHRASWFLLTVSAISLSVILWALVKYFNEGLGAQGWVFPVILLGLAIWVFFRQAIRTLLSFLLDREYGLREFNFVSALIYKAMGFVFLPMAVMVTFFDSTIVSSAAVLLALLLVLGALFRMYRGWKIGRHHQASYFYMIMYLCALELIPTLVLIRFIQSHVQI